MEIAIIDDGVNEGRYGNGKLTNNVEVTPQLTVVERKKYNNLLQSHGTTCAAIIKKYTPYANLSSIKIISSDTRRGLKGQLLAALNWCLTHKIKLIHMSVGSTYYPDYEEIRLSAAKLIDSGATIVAACSNQNIYTTPACLPNVIGVKTRAIYKEEQYSLTESNFSGIQVLASSRHALTDYKGTVETTRFCNSYAAPLITAKVHQIITAGHKSLPEIMKRLYLEDVKYSESKEYCYRPHSPEFIDSAVVFDFDQKGFKKEFFFKVADHITDEAALAVLKHKTNLVVIPSACEKTNTILKNYVLKNRENIKGLLFAGAMPDVLRECVSGDCLCWDEENNRSFLSKSLMPGLSVEVPIIAIYGKDEDALHLMKQLSLLFANEGYRSKAISSQAKSYLYGVEFIPSTVDANSFIANIEKKYLCDIVLLAAEQIEGGVTADIVIELEENGVTLSADNATIKLDKNVNLICKAVVNILKE